MKDILTFGFPGGSRRSPKIGPVFGTKTEASFLVPTMDAIFGPPKRDQFLVPKNGARFSKKVRKWGPVLGPKMGPFFGPQIWSPIKN